MRSSSWDNHPRQAGTQRTQLTGAFAQYSISGLREGVVVDVHYIDDDRNRSRSHVEYVVRDLHYPDFYHAVRKLENAYGLDDGDETPLRPAKKTLAGGGAFDQFRSASVIDGDRVLLGFIGGSAGRPVILGVLAHPSNEYGSTKENGGRRYSQHKDTSVEITKDGKYQIVRHVDGIKDGTTKTTITLEVNGDVKVEHHSGAKIHVLANNQVKLEGAASDGIRFGFAATEKVVKGDIANSVTMAPTAAAASAMQSAIALLATAYALSDGLTGVPTGATVTAVSGILSALASYGGAESSAMGAFPTSLSDKVRTE